MWLRSAAQFWLLLNAWLLLALLTMPTLRATQDSVSGRVSVVIAARNEEGRLRGTLERLLAQDLPVQILVAEGQSTDTTRAIVEQFESRGVELVGADDVPAEWLGKCWALHKGSQQATGEWLLFVDADIWFHPNVVRAAMVKAERGGFDHVTLYSGQRTRTLLGRAAHLVLGQGMLITAPPWLVSMRGASVGVGHFNLIRRTTFNKLGGYEALRANVLDDLALGRAVRKAGARTLAASGTDWIEADWAADVAGVVAATRKNAYAGVGFHASMVFLGMAFTAALLVAAWTGWAFDSKWGWLATSAWAFNVMPGLVQVWGRRGWGPASGATGPRQRGRDSLAALLTPFMQGLYVALLWNSWRATRRHVQWRGSEYDAAWLQR